MAKQRITVAAMLSAQTISVENKVSVQFRTDQNEVLTLDIPAGVIGGLIVALRFYGEPLQVELGQPVTLTSGRPFTIPDGRVGLNLLLDNAVRLPVLFPKKAIPALRSTLDKLERLASGEPSHPRQH
jgi:hypothetical protein